MKKSGREMLESADFKRLVSMKWTASVLLTAALFVMYYGYILLVAYNKPMLGGAMFEGGTATVGIVLGVLVILGAWVLTAVYVIWANRSYDVEVARLKEKFTRADAADGGSASH